MTGYRSILLVILLFFGFPLFAEEGTRGAIFLEIDPSAASVARGGAGAAYATNPAGLFHNPALAFLLNGHNLAFSHVELLADANYDYLGYVVDWGNSWRLGADLTLVSVSDIRRDAAGIERGKIKNRDYAGSILLSRRLGTSSFWGIRGKYIKQQLDQFQDETWGLDAGILIKEVVWPGLDVGLSVNNLGGDIKFVNIADDLPQNYRGGLVYHLPGNRLRVLGDLLKPENEDWEGSFGVEFTPANVLVLRTGARFYDNIESKTSFRAGLGLNFKKWHLNYAYEHFGDLGTTHRISYGLTFGKGYPDRKKGQFFPKVEVPDRTFSIEGVQNLSKDQTVDWLQSGLRELVRNELEKKGWTLKRGAQPDLILGLVYTRKDESSIAVQMIYSIDETGFRKYTFPVRTDRLFDDVGAGVGRFLEEFVERKKKGKRK